MQDVPGRWRFSFDDDFVSLEGLSWSEAVEVFRDAEDGHLVAEADGECVALEFNAAHAAVGYMGREPVTLRPYFPLRPAAAQDLETFFCDSCGIREGDRDEYLSRSLLTRADGLRLFAAVLAGPPLPSELPDPHPGQLGLPGFQEALADLASRRALEWRPLRPDSPQCPHHPAAPERSGL